jgi:hypothetical protein
MARMVTAIQKPEMKEFNPYLNGSGFILPSF